MTNNQLLTEHTSLKRLALKKTDWWHMDTYKMVGLTIVMYCDCNVMATSDTVKVCNC